MFNWPSLLQLLTHVQLVVQQESQAFLCRAACLPVSAQPVQAHGVIPSQSFTFVFVELKEIVVDPNPSAHESLNYVHGSISS